MKTVITALLLASLYCGAVHAAEPAAPPANRFAASIAPGERFESGILAVERHGSSGSPVILIPGLSSGSWAWQDMVRRLKDKHAVYVVTLPGFDGRPAASGAVFEQARAGLRQLIVSRKLDHPVLVGHSLGGTLALAVAEADSSLLRGVVSIDGLPVMPGSEQTPLAARAQMAAAMKARFAAAPASQFAAQQQKYMRGIGVTDMAMADELAKLSARSDPAAVTNIMGEVVEEDLRAGLPKISVPVLVIAPFFESDAVQRGLTEPMVKEYSAALMAGTPRLEVTTIAPSRHFVMFDQPEVLAGVLQAFIEKN